MPRLSSPGFVVSTTGLLLTIACAASAFAGDYAADLARMASPRPSTAVRVGVDYRPGELLVRFKSASDVRARGRAHASVAARVAKTYRSVPDLALVEVPAGTSVEQAAKLYRSDASVLYAEPNYVVQADVIPDDFSFGKAWGLHNTGQSGGTPDADIDAPEAWDITTGSSDVVVAVIDTGVEYTHNDLASNVFRNETDCDDDSVDDDNNGFADDCHGIDTHNDDSDPIDDNGHGTHVAGTIGASANDFSAIPGVAWNVRLMACKFLGDDGYGFISDAVECFDYIAAMHDRGVNVVASNNSWGGSGFSEALLDAIDAHRQRGILCIASAGNSGRESTSFPANYYVPNVIAVAATTRTDDLAAFSSRGKTVVHVGAPGQEILSLWELNGTRTLNGTSMASPHVAGVAALLAADDPGRDWIAIKNLILSSGDPLPALADTTLTGRRLNARDALTCSSSVALARMRPMREISDARAGVPVMLSALHVDCDQPAGAVSVTVSPGATVVNLADDGVGFDQIAGDGIYSASWTPSADGVYTLGFPNDDVVTLRVGGSAFLNPYPEDGDRFGYALAADDSAVLVGAPYDNTGGLDSGAAYLLDAANGDVLQAFYNPDPDEFDLFGISVAFDDDYVLVGAVFDDTVAEDAGAAYLFDRGSGALLHTFTSSSADPEDLFGFSVALIDGIAAVGAPRSFVFSQPEFSKVYLFSATAGSLLHVVNDPTGQLQTYLGYSMATSGSELVIGGPFSGAGVIFVDAALASPTFGAVLRSIPPPTADPGSVVGVVSGFGWSVAARGNRVLVGAPLSSIDMDPLTGESGFFAGAAFLYDGTTGDLVRALIGLLPDFFQFFGSSVALSDDAALVGAPYDSEAERAAGAAYRFDVQTGKIRQMLLGPDVIANDSIGWQVALSTGDALVSADTEDSGALDAGAVYRFASPVPQDAQKCYKSKVGAAGPRFATQVLDVEDANGTMTVNVAGVQTFCNTVDIDFTGVIEGTGHLVCYKAKPIPGTPRFVRRQVSVVTEVGLTKAELLRPARLCVPAGLDGGPISSGLGSYLCYRARRAKGSAELRSQSIHLADDFEAKSHVSGDARQICLHATVGAVSSGAPQNHLVCRGIKDRSGVPPFTRRTFDADDAFGTRQLEALKPRELCTAGEMVPLP